MKFKKNDIVRCISRPSVAAIGRLTVGEVYIIHREDSTFVYLNRGFNNPISGGWFPKRFVKLNIKDLTKKEKQKIINYKLGIKD